MFYDCTVYNNNHNSYSIYNKYASLFYSHQTQTTSCTYVHDVVYSAKALVIPAAQNPFFKPGVHGRVRLVSWNCFGPRVGMHVCVCVCVCVSASEGINNQWRDMV